MTERTRGFVIVLDQEYRVDDAQAIVDAVKMIRHVESIHMVEKASPLDLERWSAYNQLKHEVWDTFFKD